MTGVWTIPGITVIDVRQLAAEALAEAVAPDPEGVALLIPECLAVLDRLHEAGWALTPLGEGSGR